MHRTLPLPCTALALLALLALPAQAQEADAPTLQLFEPVDNGASARPAPSPAANGAVESAAFNLVGSSRFGDQYTVLLRDAEGEIIRLRGAEGERQSIPGHPGYRLITGSARSVRIEQPADAPCRDDEAAGLRCLAAEPGNIAQLSLTTADALPAPREASDRRERIVERRQERREARRQAGDGPEDNPFAAALRAARNLSEEEQEMLREQASRFQGRRVDPEDLPEGARIIRTPFGDRVVRD